LIADETHHVRARLGRAWAAQHGLIVDLKAILVHRHIGRGEDRDHARRGLSLRRVQAKDARVRPAGEQGRHVQHIGADDVAGVKGLTGYLARRINARRVVADGMCHASYPLSKAISAKTSSRLGALDGTISCGLCLSAHRRPGLQCAPPPDVTRTEALRAAP